MERIVERVARFAERERLFRGVHRLVVAVSGGPDSLALLLVARQLAPRFGLELVVAHFDHRLREDSREDLLFVRRLADGFGLRCVTGEGDVAGRARELRRGVEAVAREMRYRFLAFVAQQERAEAVATGHTAEDRVETVLLHLVRGSGVRGLRGITPLGAVPEAPALRLVRPLLELRRADTLALCEAAGFVPRADPTNEDPAFLRNRVRQRLLPLLRELNPSVDEALLRLARSAAESFGELERLALGCQPRERTPEGVVFALESLARLPAEALLLVLEREAAYLQRPVVSNATRLDNTRRVLEVGTGVVPFGPLLLEASCGSVRFGPPLPPLVLEPRTLEVPGVTRAGPFLVSVRTEPGPGEWVAVDRSRLRGALRVRSLLPGDRILVRGLSRKVSDWLLEQRVPRWWRRRVLALVDAEGVVALLGGPPTCNPPATSDERLYVRVERAGS